MERREFLIGTGAALAATLGSPLSLAALESGDSAARRVPLNHGWKFKPEDVLGSEKAEFSDAGFHEVTLPHTNAMLPWHSFDEKAYTFVSTYRRTFTLPSTMSDKRVFVDFEGAMTSSTVYFNGTLLGSYRGGYTPFSFELTRLVRWGKPNVLVVRLDSSEDKTTPPFGYEIDYLTFGGIYREVSLRVVPQVFLENVRARTLDVLSPKPALEVDCFLNVGRTGEAKRSLKVQLLDGDRVVAQKTSLLSEPQALKGAYSGRTDNREPSPDKTEMYTVRLEGLEKIELWDLRSPRLYRVVVSLEEAGRVSDTVDTRVGFREAMFTPEGFRLNHKIVKLRGLNRHQTFPFVGGAMPGRVQRMDADILKRELHCNLVRTSHYPQSRHFLDRCDEIGLLVLEEIPGWQNIGDDAWKDRAVDNVRRMIQRDWNRPSIILWGVRINESRDDDAFYTRTNELAHALDATRQTGGIRNRTSSHLIEDVFTINDFGFPLQAPNHALYLNTEFVGHTFPTKSTDDDERQREHTLRHARIHDQIASDHRFAGGIGWCAFDYNTHAGFGSGDRICYHGVMDIFRLPKPAAGFYKSQCDPAEEVVLEPAFHWARGDESQRFVKLLICSNCESLRAYFRPQGEGAEAWHELATVQPDREDFKHLPYPPFLLDLSDVNLHKFSFSWGDLRLDGYIGGKKVISKSLSGQGVDQDFRVEADSTELHADGSDATRVKLMVTDEFGARRPFANDAITLRLEGPGEILGDNPFALIGGAGAVWIRARQEPGVIRLHATHPRFGMKTVELKASATETRTLL